MNRILFVSNGHGEAAIAERIAEDLRAAGSFACDHLALVGGDENGRNLAAVGPRKAMPSGGLIAMGNVRNIVKDLAAGLLGHTLAQLRFVRQSRGTYATVVAVGDIYALLVALRSRAPTIYVGTAKSVHVAPYGPFEERVLRRARAVFVRDEETARALRGHGVAAEAPGNVIVDLFAGGDAAAPGTAYDPTLALFPGSRSSAYEEAAFLCAIVRAIAGSRIGLGAILSVAPNLDSGTFARVLARDGWTVNQDNATAIAPFTLYDGGRPIVTAWSGALGDMLGRAALVLGQAGTANEAACAGGVPVVAFETAGKKSSWYRMRQVGLLGDALLVVRGDRSAAAAAVDALLDDEPRRMRMGDAGRKRMGSAGGSRAIAHRVAAIAQASA